MAFLSGAYAFVLAHWQLIGFLAVVLSSLLNRLLPGHPAYSGVVRQLVALLAATPMVGARSGAFSWLAAKLGDTLAGAIFDGLSKWLDIPILSVSVSAPGSISETPPPRGFARLSVLCLIAAAAFLAALPARAAPTGGTLADVAPSDPLPGNSQFGGCVGVKKNVCFAPSVSLSLMAYNIKTGKLEGAFAPGLGYGLTVNPGKWSSVGGDFYMTVDPGAQQASVSFLGSFFNGYFRPGVSKAFINDHAWRFLFASVGVAIQ